MLSVGAMLLLSPHQTAYQSGERSFASLLLLLLSCSRAAVLPAHHDARRPRRRHHHRRHSRRRRDRRSVAAPRPGAADWGEAADRCLISQAEGKSRREMKFSDSSYKSGLV